MPVLSYLRFVLAAGADREAFERDLAAIRDLARLQPGYRWDEVGRDPWDGRRYVVVTEWEDVDGVRAFEHHLEHEEVIRRWEGWYSEDFQHQRFVPWVRPVAAEEVSGP